MIGDIYLFIKKFLHQHFFCIHDYKTINRRDNGGCFNVCDKCDLIE